MTIQQRIKILFGKEVTTQHVQNPRWYFVSPAVPQHKHQLVLVRRLSQHLEEKKKGQKSVQRIIQLPDTDKDNDESKCY
jgi:hypothetical protein